MKLYTCEINGSKLLGVEKNSGIIDITSIGGTSEMVSLIERFESLRPAIQWALG